MRMDLERGPEILGVQWHRKVKNQNKKHSVSAGFHLFQHHTISRVRQLTCPLCLRRAVKTGQDIRLPQTLWTQTLPFQSGHSNNVGRRFCESFHKMFHLPHQDHSQSTFLSYRILNYWEFINCWIYDNLCLYVTENGVRADIESWTMEPDSF